MKDIKATIIIDLTNKTEEKLWKNIERSRRKNINKAKKSGLIFERFFSSQDIYESYQIYSKVWEDGGTNPKTYEFWKNLIDSKDYKLFIVKYKKEIIACAVIKEVSKKMYNKSNSNKKGIRFYAFASKKEFNNFRPNDFLYWNSILYSLKAGFNFIDLGGYQINARGHLKGINRFKSQWGGKIVYYYVDFPFYKVIGRKLIRKFRFFWWLNKKIKRRKEE